MAKGIVCSHGFLSPTGDDFVQNIGGPGQSDQRIISKTTILELDVET